ncbi:MAG: Gfo/Idh/MocA family oxidoreductase [Phycisphaeraceae bacterium]|nr:Gfo/Idh/MocA family oxidoreductase [Phycisphaeraceae bacterium]
MLTRRHFLKSSAMAAPLILTPSMLGAIRRAQPNSRLGVGLIGCGKRMFEMVGEFLDQPDVQVLAVCDVDTTRREHVKSIVDRKYGTSDCRPIVDYRDMLSRKDIDAVVIGTPDHWHINQVMHAAMHGKDIYCEKPLTLNLRECQLMIDAVKKAGVVFQTGSQQRTEYDGKFRKAIEYIRSGRIGDILSVHVGVGTSSKWCDLGEEALEPGLEWDLWLGPAPKRPYHSTLSPRGVHNHYPQWRLYREYSGGILTDMGAHNFDIAQWGLGMDASGPVEVHPPAEENAQFGATLVYKNGTKVIHGGPDGTTFTGTRGVIHVFRGSLVSIPDGILKQELKESDFHLPQVPRHIRNWLDCIKTRQQPECNAEVGCRSIACAHLCNLAYWHKRPLKWDPQRWEFPGDAEANTWLDYSRRSGYELPKA